MRVAGNRRGRAAAVLAFARREDGGASFEACLWVPFLLLFFFLIMDATFIFSHEADAQRIVQDGTRQYVSKALDSETELETWLETVMASVSPNADATVDYDSSTGILVASVEYPAGDTDLTGVTGWLSGVTMRVQSIQLMEQ
jgi:Flp pilus assembly protein TadG